MIYVPKTPEENKTMADWAAKIIKQEEMFAPPYQCMGFTRNGKMACVVVAHDYRKPNVFMSFAATDPHWATRTNLRHVVTWAFDQLGCTRITGIVDPRNDRARRFDEAVGFKLEGTLRRARPDGGKILIYGLVREDFERFLTRKRHAAPQTKTA